MCCLWSWQYITKIAGIQNKINEVQQYLQKHAKGGWVPIYWLIYWFLIITIVSLLHIVVSAVLLIIASSDQSKECIRQACLYILFDQRY